MHRPRRAPAGRPHPRWLAAPALLALAVVLSGCWPARILGLRPERAAGPVAVSLAVPASAFETGPGQSPPATLRVSLVKDARLMVQERPLQAPEGDEAVATFVFDQVYEGRWEVAGELLDAEGDAVYAGATRLYVTAGETATVRLTLAARPALLRTQIDLSGYDRQALVTAAGVHLKGPSTAYLKASRPGRDLVWSFDRERQPGTYDLRLVLYQDGGAIEYSREYTGVVLLPGKTTALRWRPATGGAIVIGEIDWVPAAPGDVTCQVLPSEAALRVAWSPPPDPDVAGYRVYLRPPESSLRLAEEVTAGASQVTLADPTLPWRAGGAVYVGVTAVDLAGQESLHAPGWCEIPGPSGPASVVERGAG